MTKHTLNDIAEELVADGQVEEANALLQVQAELDASEKPPGLFKRLSTAVRETAQQQWSHIVGELQESKEAWALIQNRVKTGESMNAVDKEIVRAQLMDIFKVFPATVVATANAAVPIPGSGLLTPWLLNKLGLMPTRWREAHALHELQAQEEHLRSIGDIDHADKVHGVIDQLTADADAREEMEERCALLTVWDANQNGVWDADEIETYRQAVQEIRTKLAEHGQKKQWYFMLHSHVFGPVRLNDIDDWTPDEKLLICFDAKSGWVSFADVIRRDGSLSVSPPALVE